MLAINEYVFHSSSESALGHLGSKGLGKILIYENMGLYYNGRD